MTLGLGIFLSSLFLGVIYLFVVTKDRWNWKKILFVWPLIVILVVGVIGGGGFYIYNYYENKPITYDTYWDIPINSNINDVLFLKGKPSSIYHAENYYQKEMVYDEVYDEKTIATYYNIRFNENNVIEILCRFRSSIFAKEIFESPKCPSLNNININSRADELKDLLGEPSIEIESDNKFKRIWVYKKYRSLYILRKGMVVALGIYNPPFNAELSNDNFYEYKSIELRNGDIIKYAPKYPREKNLENVKASLKIAKEQSPQTTEFLWDELIEIHDKVRIEQLARVEEIRKLQEKAKAKEKLKAEEETKKLLAKAKAKEQAKAKAKEQAKEQKQDKFNRFLDAEDGAFNHAKWKKLKKGLATYQVEKLLGEPIRREGRTSIGQTLYWYYSEDRRDGAHVYFTKNYDIGIAEVAGWKVP